MKNTPAGTHPGPLPGATASLAQPGPLARERRLTLGPVRTSPRCARATVRESLQAWHLTYRADDAEAITSELVTNAITASITKAPPATLPRPVTLRLTIEPARAELLIAVWDPDPTPPATACPGDLAENGRGLLIVAALASRWGWQPATPNGGKWVWAALPVYLQRASAREHYEGKHQTGRAMP